MLLALLLFPKWLVRQMQLAMCNTQFERNIKQPTKILNIKEDIILTTEIDIYVYRSILSSMWSL